MNKRTRKQALFNAVSISFALKPGRMLITACFFVNNLAATLMTYLMVKVFFEAEKKYTVNFKDRSPRSASQVKRNKRYTTWANIIVNNSERISRNLRGFDLLSKLEHVTNITLQIQEKLYITPYSISKPNNKKLQTQRVYVGCLTNLKKEF